MDSPQPALSEIDLLIRNLLNAGRAIALTHATAGGVTIEKLKGTILFS